MVFIYKDNSNHGQIVFTCEADGILEADILYKEETGKDVTKQPYIGCTPIFTIEQYVGGKK